MGNDTAIIDIETLGTSASSVVLSVGMVVVDSEKDYTFDELIFDGFYEKLDVAGQVKAGRKLDKSTLDWWATQGTEARRVLTPASTDIPHCGLSERMTKYLDKKGTKKKNLRVYSRGSHFDFGILHDLFRVTCNETADQLPWNWWHIHDSKTVVYTLLGYDIRNKIKPAGFIYHNALHDAAREYITIQTALYKFQETLA